MSPTNTSASLTLPINSFAASGLWHWIMTFIGWGLVPALEPGSAFCLGVCCCSPSWSLKALHSRCCSTHVACVLSLAVIVLDLVWITSPSQILIASGCIVILVTTLPLGPLVIVIGALIVIPLTLFWIPVMGVSVVPFLPL